ncbi:unnamed protein product, partial [Didymodactylos carnosus]
IKSNLSMSTEPSPFYIACEKGDLNKVKSLFIKVNPDKLEPNGSTALHVAAYYGYYDIVKYLLEHGCSPNINNQYGRTADQEASNDQIREIFQQAKDGKIQKHFD